MHLDSSRQIGAGAPWELWGLGVASRATHSTVEQLKKRLEYLQHGRFPMLCFVVMTFPP